MTAAHLGPRGGRSVRAAVVLAGVGSGLSYLVMYLAQRAIHRGPAGPSFTVGMALYFLAVITAFAFYVWLLLVVRRAAAPPKPAMLFAFPAAQGLVWLATAPVFSSDVFAYIAHGYVRTALGDNPYFVHSSAVAASPLGPELGQYGWRPVHPATPYGPLLTQLEVLVVRITDGDVRLAMVLFKLLALASTLATAWLVWWILGRVRPRERALGVVAFLWNPAVLVETAGEGHNDAVMAFLVVLGLGLTLRRWVVAAVTALSAAVLTKYLPLLIVPLQMVFLWRAGDRARLVPRYLAGMLAGAVLAVVMFAPFWSGFSTLQGLSQSGSAGHTGSTQTLLVEIVSRAGSEALALRVVPAAMAGLLLVTAMVLAVRVRDDYGLLRSAAVLLVVAMLLVSPAYWPWYVVLPVAVLALVPETRFLVLLVAVALGARMVAPLNSMYVQGLVDRPGFFLLTWVGAVGLPLLAVLAHAVMRLSEGGSARRLRR